MSARLAQASMGEQLFGHALAGLRFGATLVELEEAVEIAFSISPVKGAVAEKAHAEAVKILGMVRFIIKDNINLASYMVPLCGTITAFSCLLLLHFFFSFGSQRQNLKGSFKAFPTICLSLQSLIYRVYEFLSCIY